MVSLPAEPLSTVRTVPHLRDLARGLSGQAAVVYRDLSERMQEFGNEPAREAFERIADLLRGDETEESAAAMAGLPKVFQAEDLDATRLVTPYAAFSVAVRNQRWAFNFWTYVSANSPTPDVQTEAERLARREMARMRSLRAERRRAFYADRPPVISLETLRTTSIPQLKLQAAEMEQSLAALHDRIGASLAEAGDPRATALRAVAAEERENADRLDAAAMAPEEEEALPDDSRSLVALATERLEAAVELYLAAAEASQREEVVAVAQDLADRGIRRLSLLR